MAVLVCLARHAPGVVKKERLLEEVWSDSPFIGEEVISHAIWELRKALGDSARDSVYIRTVPRKGYQVVAEILRPQGSPLPMEGVRIGHYDLETELGRGSMGVVYQAVDRRLGRSVAIKFLAPELTRDTKACQRFEREARLAASLDHPNLATVYEIGETSEGHRFLVGAYYKGGSLKDRLAEGPLELDEALRLVRQLVAGLGAAHQRDIVHRDVKPANLLLDENGILKICDFGIAKLLGATDLTRTGTPLGTPAYKSPEQAQGQTVDHRTDLWSAGVVLFELITGRRPFDGGYEHAVVHSILSREPPDLEEAVGAPVPEPLRRFVARALAKDPAQRYQSAEQMAAALDRIGEQVPVPSPVGAGWRWTAVAASVLALIGVGWLSYREQTPRMPDSVPAARNTEAERAGIASQKGWDHLVQGRNIWLRGNYPANLVAVRQQFEQAVALLPNSTEAKGHLAAFLADIYSLNKKEQDRDEARALIREILAADPESSLARVAESWLLILEADLEKGERLAREARAIEPECDRGEICDLAYLRLGEALWMQGRADEAFAILDQGTRVGGGRIRCRLKRAQLYERSGKKREAEEEYLQVLQLDGEQTTALLGLANLYLKMRRFDEAVPLLSRLYKTTGDPKVLISKGYALYERELWDLAIETYSEAHEAYQAAGEVVPTPLMAIGDIYLELGRKDEAQVQYQRALEMFDAMKQPGILRQAQRAVCLAKLDHFEEGVEEIQRLLPRTKDFSDLLFYAARIYALKGDRETLLELARQWIGKGHEPARFLDDPAFIPYRKDREYLRILEPQLIPAN